MSAGTSIGGRHRWAKPVDVLDTVESNALVQFPDGTIMGDVQVSVDNETWERLRQGRVCANCFEPLEEAFPEVCNALKLPDGTVVGCFYKVRECQIRDLTSRHGAGQEVRLGPRVNKAEELERLRELDAYEQRTGIRLPDSVKFPVELIEGHSKNIGSGGD